MLAAVSVEVHAHPHLEGARYATLSLVDLEVVPDRLRGPEREIFDQIRGTEARLREWYAGRLAARAALNAIGHPDVVVLRATSGAPRLEGTGAEALHVAITHGRRLAAAVATRADAAWPHVGIDIVDNEDEPRVRRVAKRVLKPEETARCEADDLHTRLAWGAREAVAKATETGMFVFALSQCWTTGVTEPERRVLVNLDDVSVIYEPLDDGGVLVLAGASQSAYERAQAAAAG